MANHSADRGLHLYSGEPRALKTTPDTRRLHPVRARVPVAPDAPVPAPRMSSVPTPSTALAPSVSEQARRALPWIAGWVPLMLVVTVAGPQATRALAGFPI